VISRPDLAYAAGVPARYIGQCSLDHYKAAKHLLRYIRTATDLCLAYNAEAVKRAILGYVNAEWVECLNTRRSITGYVVKTFSGLVMLAWRSRRQPTVALSTVEAELMASVDTAKQAVWMNNLLSDFKLSIDELIKIFSEDIGAVHLSQHPDRHDRTKHVDMRHLWLREKVANKTVVMQHVATEDILADTFTL
jgi:hypothetical protein